MRISDWSSDVCSSDLVVAAARVADDDLELVAVAADVEGIDAASEAAADMHFGLVPDAHLDAALEVGDLDLAVGMERTGFVDRGGGQRRGGQGRQQQRQEEAEGHGGDSVRLSVWMWTGAATGPVAGRRGFAGRSEEHTSELQSLMRISYAVFCLKKKNSKMLQEK